MPFEFIKRLFESETPAQLHEDDARAAIAAVLVMAARADNEYADAEKAMIDRVLAERYHLSPFEAAALRANGEAAEGESIDLYKFTRAIRDAIPHQDRVAILEGLWRVVLADNYRDPHEDALMRQVAERLGLSPRELALARQKVSDGGAIKGM